MPSGFGRVQTHNCCPWVGQGANRSTLLCLVQRVNVGRVRDGDGLQGAQFTSSRRHDPTQACQVHSRSEVQDFDLFSKRFSFMHRLHLHDSGSFGTKKSVAFVFLDFRKFRTVDRPAGGGKLIAFCIEDLQGLHLTNCETDQHRRNVPSKIVLRGEWESRRQSQNGDESDAGAARKKVEKHL